MANVFANEAVRYFTAQIEVLLARASSVATAAAILRDRGLMQNATFHDVEAIASNASRRLNPSSCIRGDKCKICC